MATLPLVVRVDDPEAGSVAQYAFLRSPVRVGRGELNDLRLDYPFVSSWHGVIQFDEEGISIVDLGSTNGTTLGGARLERNVPARIGPEDDLRIGTLRLHLVRREIAQPPPARKAASQFALHAVTPPRPVPTVGESGMTVAQPAAADDGALQALEAAAWQLGILDDAIAQARKNFDDALTQAVAGLPEATRGRALALAAERYATGVTAGAPAPAPSARKGPGAVAADGGLGVEALRLLRTFAESYLQAPGAALDSTQALEGFLGAAADVLETAAKSYLELRRGYDEFGREMGIRVASGDGPVTRARDTRALLAWLLQPTEGESRAADLASGFADLMIHQVALLNGVTEGARELVGRLSPEAVTTALEQAGGGKVALGLKPLREGAQWRAFVERYREVAEEEGAFSDALFGKAFARAYSAVAGRSVRDRETPQPDGGTPRPGGRGRAR